MDEAFGEGPGGGAPRAAKAFADGRSLGEGPGGCARREMRN